MPIGCRPLIRTPVFCRSIKACLAIRGNASNEHGPLFPSNLIQPTFTLPFEVGALWAFTGGPHPAWEAESAWGALDFAPAAAVSGCAVSNAWVVAVAPGQIVRSESSYVVLDLDGDGFEQTGWVVIYQHIATKDRIPAGTWVNAGARIGHPSCEGGEATGTNLHIARKYNGEWVAAGGPLPFDLSGWMAHEGDCSIHWARSPRVTRRSLPTRPVRTSRRSSVSRVNNPFRVPSQEAFSALVIAFSLAACLPQGAGTLIPITPTQTSTAGAQLPRRCRHVQTTIPANWWITSPRPVTPSRRWQRISIQPLMKSGRPTRKSPPDATTMPPGMPMKIPIYYLPFWGTSPPDPARQPVCRWPFCRRFRYRSICFQPSGLAEGLQRLCRLATTTPGPRSWIWWRLDYSISPRVLLALLEYQTGALSQPVQPTGDYPLGNVDYNYAGLYLQLIWAANMLNVGYYGWRTGNLTEFQHPMAPSNAPIPGRLPPRWHSSTIFP